MVRPRLPSLPLAPASIGICIARLARERAGNTLAIVAAALLPLIAIIGGGIDMGRSYLAETRLQQACDAGALAARKALGSSIAASGIPPSGVADRGNQLFNLNFRSGSYGTRNVAFNMTLEPDYSITGAATVEVPTTIMAIFGFSKFDVQVNCQSQLNFSNTDVMMVLDTTGSMNDTNPGDTQPKIAILKNVVTSFYNQLEAQKGPGTRIRYGFVPYSVNANVGALLQDNWVVSNWAYQSRQVDHTTTTPGTYQYTANWVNVSGTYSATLVSTYAATYHASASEAASSYYSCDSSPPGNTYTGSDIIMSTTSQPYAGPPAGTETIEHHKLTENGDYYWINLNGTSCEIWGGHYDSLLREYDLITIPVNNTNTFYQYAPISQDVSNWKNWNNGCMEERSTYEIMDYTNVDLTRALDLDIDTLPNSSNPSTQWRPANPNVIYERSLDWYGNGSFSVAPVISDYPYMFQATSVPGLSVCPSPARKLAEIAPADLANYLATLTVGGATYHSAGMIWGGRLLSPTGLFASENADVPGKPTNRNLIFLTDGQTETYDIAYGAYGVEPLDQRRWDPNSSLTLNQVEQNRFSYVCNEVKSHNITVWTIGFGTTVPKILQDCAGAGHWFQADNATQLAAAFNSIANSLGDLRISQ